MTHTSINQVNGKATDSGFVKSDKKFIVDPVYDTVNDLKNNLPDFIFHDCRSQRPLRLEK